MERKFPVGLLTIIVGGLSFVALSPSAQAQNCSAASLHGSYAVSRQGTLLTSVLGLPAPAPYGEVALANFDGGGGLSGTASVNIGGIVVRTAFTGTYTVNSDCSGSVIVYPSVPVTITEDIIVIKNGQAYVGTDTESFATEQTRGERLGG